MEYGATYLKSTQGRVRVRNLFLVHMNLVLDNESITIHKQTNVISRLQSTSTYDRIECSFERLRGYKRDLSCRADSAV